MLLRAALLSKLHKGLLQSRHPLHGRLRKVASVASNRKPYCFVAPRESATQHLAALLAGDLRAGDCYCFFGEVGAGKSVFSRGFIRAAAEDDDLPVPSPTYLLQQIYEDHSGPPIHHFDLYRLDSNSGLGRLDLPKSFNQAVSLIEWADRLLQLPPERLQIHISLLDEQSKAKLLSEGTVEDTPDTSGEEELVYEDNHWRSIHLQPIGMSWETRVQAIARAVVANPDTSGLSMGGCANQQDVHRASQG